MRINHNIGALNTYSRLSQANAAQSKSLEKLSSGLRINRAGDDAAGLAISEKMRAQIRGLGQAGRNAQDGISMIQTAEGALNETHSILQRMRELAVQAGNDTNTTEDRSQIQGEINQLSSEINRIAGTTEFNKQRLLDGTQSANAVAGASTSVQVAGKNSTEAVYTIEFTSCLGADLCGSTCDIGMSFAGTEFVPCQTCLNSNGTLSDYVSNIAARFNANTTLNASWVATANGNKITFAAKDGVSAVCGTSGNDKVFCFTSGDELCLGGLSNVSFHNCSESIQTTKGINSTQQINYLSLTDASIKEGTTFSIGRIKFALYDHSSGNYTDQTDFVAKLNLDPCTHILDINNADYDEANEILGCVANCINGCTDYFTSVTYDSNNGRICVVAACSGAIGSVMAAVSASGASGTAATADNGITLQIGANAGQNFNVSFANMTGSGIGISSKASGANVIASDGKVASFISTASVENNGGSLEYSLDVSTATKASAAVSVIEDAISAVSNERAKLGSYQNRLEYTINNLGTSAENLTAAESRIRDVDMAKEMMEFTKNNILNQAATAMLAQANQQPQGVLQLLR